MGRVTGKGFRHPTEGALGSLQAPSEHGVFWSEHRVGTKFKLPAGPPASIASTLATCIPHKLKGILEGRTQNLLDSPEAYEVIQVTGGQT